MLFASTLSFTRFDTHPLTLPVNSVVHQYSNQQVYWKEIYMDKNHFQDKLCYSQTVIVGSENNAACSITNIATCVNCSGKTQLYSCFLLHSVYMSCLTSWLSFQSLCVIDVSVYDLTMKFLSTLLHFLRQMFLLLLSGVI